MQEHGDVGKSGLTPTPSTPTPILFHVPSLSCVTSGLGLQHVNTPAHMPKLCPHPLATTQVSPLGVNAGTCCALRRMDLGKLLV